MFKNPGFPGYVGLSALKAGTSYLAQATKYLGGVTPYHYWDFINNRALFAQDDVGGVANTPGWSFTRASTGYAETAAGVLVPFASGALRRTDKGVLIEGARTNLALQSQTFDNASWGKTNTAVTADAAAAPDGSATADKSTPSGSASGKALTQAYTSTAASYTVSCFAKASGYGKIGIRENTSSGSYATFDLSGAGSVISTLTATATIRALANGWYFCSMKYTGAAVSQTIALYVLDAAFTSGSGSPHSYAYTADGSSGAFFWGAQIELGAFPSSYIPTTTASATRAADVLTVSSPGVSYPLGLFAEAERAVDTGSYENILGVDDGTNSNRTLLFLDTSDQVAASARTATVEQLNIPVTGAVAIGAATKSAIRMDTNNAIIARGGTLSALDSTVTLPANPTRVTFSPSQELFGYIRRAAIINFAPSNAQLTAMTI